MPFVLISAECHRQVCANARKPLALDWQWRLPDGSWHVNLDTETIQRLEAVKLPGETISDTIERLFTEAAARKNNPG